MCDYSLERLASRPAKVGDHLMTTKFRHTLTGGFCAVSEPNVAVCLQPGTELAFDREIESGGGLLPWRSRTLGVKVARFRHVNEGQRHMHHDALELPGGKIVMLTCLREGQQATVLHLPIGERMHKVEIEVSHHVWVAD
jgi:hypothetical protein